MLISLVLVRAAENYSLRPAKTVRLAFKFCPTKTVHLDGSTIPLIKVISNTKKELP